MLSNDKELASGSGSRVYFKQVLNNPAMRKRVEGNRVSDRGDGPKENQFQKSRKEILTNNDIDVLGISEANIESNIDSSLYNIDGYYTARSSGNISRICVFYESNLAVKLIDRKLNNLTAKWLEIGTGNNKWLVCNFYRDHRILGQNGSERMEHQLSRFDFFCNGC